MDEFKAESPFDNSFFDAIPNWLKKHGVALSKILFMLATAAATFEGAMKAASVGGTFASTIFAMVIGCGLLLEAGFAYSWIMHGSDKIAGKQKDMIVDMHSIVTRVMWGDLICMLIFHQVSGLALGGELVAGLTGWLFVIWTSLVQPGAAVWIMKQYFKIKGAHPITQALNKATTLRAKMLADWIEEQSKEQDLALQRSENRRLIDYRDLEIEVQEDNRVVNSRRYRMIKRHASETRLLKMPEGEGKKGKSWWPLSRN